MVTNSPKFQSEHIVFSFGVISDFHIRLDPTPEQDNRGKLQAALRILQRRAAQDDPHGLSLLVGAGDLTHDGKHEEIALLRDTMAKAFPLDRIPFIYVAGNHDKHNPTCNTQLRCVFGGAENPLFDAQYAAPDGIDSGNRHYVVDGRHFITLDPIKYQKKEPIVFTDSTKAWLDSTLSRITAQQPQAYVYLILHLPIWDTCYGTTRGYFYATEDLSAILRKYPQVMAFGGHLHFPLNDERAIMQRQFTCMETATLSDMLINAFDCDNVRKGTKPQNNREFAQGLLVQLDAAGNVRVKRLDLWRDAEIGQPWLLDAPSADGAHLRRYTAARAAQGAAPCLHGSVSAAHTVTEDGTPALSLTFDAPQADALVIQYTVTLTDRTSGETRTVRLLTDFYRYPQPCDMPSRVTLCIPDVLPTSYDIAVTAHDSWDRVSAPIVGTI